MTTRRWQNILIIHLFKFNSTSTHTINSRTKKNSVNHEAKKNKRLKSYIWTKTAVKVLKPYIGEKTHSLLLFYLCSTLWVTLICFIIHLWVSPHVKMVCSCSRCFQTNGVVAGADGTHPKCCLRCNSSYLWRHQTGMSGVAVVTVLL